MIKRYAEQRSVSGDVNTALMADVMRHFHARQNLGPALVVSSAADCVAQAERQWRRLSRELQKRRGFATNPVEILKYTYTIATMQHVRLSSELPEYQPGAGLYVLRPDQLADTALTAMTVYVTSPAAATAMAAQLGRLAPDGLLVDYTARPGFHPMEDTGLLPRAQLEVAANLAWSSLAAYLSIQGVDVATLTNHGSSEQIDDAVDRLLGVQASFLEQAGQFQHALDLARPLITTPKQVRDRYETTIRLAHRVQTFATTGFSARFLHTYTNDDFLLRDRPAAAVSAGVAEQVRRHLAAGRYNLARALMAQPAAGLASSGLAR
ncbi:MAG TPA: hypothetical protein VI322_00565 [Candidatus Saccharimonadia bacterium]